jgi:hypothetical protein
MRILENDPKSRSYREGCLVVVLFVRRGMLPPFPYHRAPLTITKPTIITLSFYTYLVEALNRLLSRGRSTTLSRVASWLLF